MSTRPEGFLNLDRILLLDGQMMITFALWVFGDSAQLDVQCVDHEKPLSVYSTWHLSSAEDKNFPFCPQLRTQKMYENRCL